MEKFLGGGADGRTSGRTDAQARTPAESLTERRDRLDGELRRGLERLGLVVRGPDVARAVSVAVGKRIEWVG